MNFLFEEGETLLINKPLGWTSFDVIRKIRILLKYYKGIRKLKVGHAGTLDPLASGLLICCTGKATKKIGQLQDLEKEYLATIALGKTTPSYDLETPVNQTFPVSHITKEALLDILHEFVGVQDQVPPVFSAKNVGGKRAYKLARNGQEVTLKSQEINIKKIEAQTINLPEFTIKVLCSKGTYIRALTRDIGIKLKSGAVLTSLVRTAIGNYKLSAAMTLEDFENILIENKQN